MRQQDIPGWEAITPSGEMSEEEKISDDDELQEDTIHALQKSTKKRTSRRSAPKPALQSHPAVERAVDKLGLLCPGDAASALHNNLPSQGSNRNSAESTASTAVASMQTCSSETAFLPGGKDPYATSSSPLISRATPKLNSGKPQKSLIPSRRLADKYASQEQTIFSRPREALYGSTNPWPYLSDEKQHAIMRVNLRFSKVVKPKEEVDKDFPMTPTVPALPHAAFTRHASQSAQIPTTTAALPAPFAVQALPPHMRFKQALERAGFVNNMDKLGGDARAGGMQSSKSTDVGESASAAGSSASAAGSSASIPSSTSTARTATQEEHQVTTESLEAPRKKRSASTLASDLSERGKRARTSELPAEEVVNGWLVQLRALAKGKRALDDAELRTVSDTMREVSAYGKLPWAFLESSGLAGAVDQVAQMRVGDVPGGDEHGLRRRAGALLDMWTE